MFRLDLPKLLLGGWPVGQQGRGFGAVGGVEVVVGQLLKQGDVGDIVYGPEFDHLEIGQLGETTGFVEYVSDAAGHTGAEIPADGSEDDDHAIGHVFAPVVTHALDDGGGSGVANGEAFAGAAVGEEVAATGSVEAGIAEDAVVGRHKAGFVGRADDDFPAGHAFADVVIGFTGEAQDNAAAEESAEALSGAAMEIDGDGFLGQSVITMEKRHLAAQFSTDVAVGILDVEAKADRHFIADGVFGALDDFVIERVVVEAVVTIFQAAAREVEVFGAGHVVQQF